MNNIYLLPDYARHEYYLIDESSDRVLILKSYLWRWYFCSKVQALSLLYGTLITFMFLPIDVFSMDMRFIEKIFNVI